MTDNKDDDGVVVNIHPIAKKPLRDIDVDFPILNYDKKRLRWTTAEKIAESIRRLNDKQLDELAENLCNDNMAFIILDKLSITINTYEDEEYNGE
jgi:hypothetical protein|tara:strand:- start:860 stop:1144 length:285 start_codon:yes stop_codon:yes gene_type:complete